jgi:hypothetical protein
MPQLGEHLHERAPVLEVVVGQAMDGDRLAGVVPSDDVAPGPGEADPGAVHRHPAHCQQPVTDRGQPRGLDVHGEQGQHVESGLVVRRHDISRTG